MPCNALLPLQRATRKFGFGLRAPVDVRVPTTAEGAERGVLKPDAKQRTRREWGVLSMGSDFRRRLPLCGTGAFSGPAQRAPWLKITGEGDQQRFPRDQCSCTTQCDGTKGLRARPVSGFKIHQAA